MGASAAAAHPPLPLADSRIQQNFLNMRHGGMSSLNSVSYPRGKRKSMWRREGSNEWRREGRGWKGREGKVGKAWRNRLSKYKPLVMELWSSRTGSSERVTQSGIRQRPRPRQCPRSLRDFWSVDFVLSATIRVLAECKPCAGRDSAIFLSRFRVCTWTIYAKPAFYRQPFETQNRAMVPERVAVTRLAPVVLLLKFPIFSRSESTMGE